MTHKILSLMYPRTTIPATFLFKISECKSLPVQNLERMVVYVARPFLSVSIPGP